MFGVVVCMVWNNAASVSGQRLCFGGAWFAFLVLLAFSLVRDGRYRVVVELEHCVRQGDVLDGSMLASKERIFQLWAEKKVKLCIDLIF